MKFVCTQENLSKGLAVVGHIASRNTSLPILNNILLRAEKGVVRLSATNLEIGITKQIRGKIEHDGVCTIPGKVFSDYVSLVHDDALSVEQDGGVNTVVTSKKGRIKLNGLPAEDFPLIPTIERANGYHVDSSELRRGISQVVFAAAYDDARPEISGVFLRFFENTLKMVATDSYRLAEKKIQTTGGGKKDVGVIVPVRALQELVRILGQNDEKTSIFVAENQILFVVNETELVSRLIDGQYPNYEQIIPVNHDSQATLVTEDFVNAVRATSLFSRPGINDCTLAIVQEKGIITLGAANTQIGENHQEVDAEIEGASNSIVFNSRYILDGCANLEAEKITFQMTNNASPGVFRPAGDDGYLYIVMPIKQ
jgi:DNA polymerase-3 subunit beta